MNWYGYFSCFDFMDICKWLPFCVLSNQPSSYNTFNNSFTFIIILFWHSKGRNIVPILQIDSNKKFMHFFISICSSEYSPRIQLLKKVAETNSNDLLAFIKSYSLPENRIKYNNGNNHNTGTNGKSSGSFKHGSINF